MQCCMRGACSREFTQGVQCVSNVFDLVIIQVEVLEQCELVEYFRVQMCYVVLAQT